ncbi:MAG TPA: hypothetical protein VF784_15590 [Anaerolineales bacterium]
MTDWDEIVEYIHNAMRAVDEAHSAAEQLQEDTNHTNFRAFCQKMAELQERQTKLKMVLDNEEAYAVDELMDALSLAFTDHRADYRRTPRMRE